MCEYSIEINSMSAHYGNGGKHVQALKDVALCVKRGEIFGLLGPNGAGKTTLLACIEGLHAYDTGSVTIGGVDVRRNTVAAKRKLGIQLQRAALIEGLTAVELIQTYAALYDIYPTRARIDQLLKDLQLSDQANKRAKQMSGGQQQRLSLAIAVITDPEIVLLDEPTEALDPAARRYVWSIIRSLKDQGRTVVITTHSMDEAESLCGRVAIINSGQIIACDSPQELINAMHVNPMLKVRVELPLEQVQPLDCALSARYTGEHLEVETSQPIVTLNALYQLAAKHGRVLRDIAIRQPNLEDVYLKMTGNSLTA